MTIDGGPATAAPTSPAAATAGPVDAAITVLLCRDLGDRELLSAVAAAARSASLDARVYAVDDVCGRPRRLRATTSNLHAGRTVVACRRGRRAADDIRLALRRAGVRPDDIVIADLAEDRGHRRPTHVTDDVLCAAVRVAVARATTIDPPPGPPRCRTCGAPLGGPPGAGGPVDISAVVTRLAASHPAVADRLLHADRCADCLLTEGIARRP